MAVPEDAEVADLIELRGNLSRIFEEIVNTRRTTAGVTVSPETSLECSAVLACVRVLAESIASMPFGVYRRLADGGKEIAEDQHLHEVLAHQPNSWMTAFEFRELMQSWLLLWGNSFALIKSGRRGAVDELIPLHPSRMEVKRLSNGKLRYYYREPTTPTQPEVEVTEYRQDEIFHLRWLSSDGVTGYTPTTLSREAIGLARATELHSSAFFGNGAKAGTYIEVDQPQKPESLMRFKAQWDEAHAGPTNSYKTVVMPYGFKKKEDPVNNQHAELIATRRYAVEEIARAYRVPLHLLGDLTNVRYSTAEQSSIDFITFSLIPWCRRWEMACRRDLVVDDQNFFCQFDTNALLAGDYQARAQFLREAFNNAAIDIDEYRAAIGYNPLPDGAGKKRFIQVNMQLLSAFTPENPTGKKEPAAPAPAPGGPGASDEGVPEGEIGASSTTPRADSEAEVVFRTNLRRIAGVEADGILKRRNQPEKLAAWLDATQTRIRTELRDAAQATGRDIDQFAAAWVARSRDLLLDCHRSGKPYETATEDWCDKHLTTDAAAT
ncbi:MAG: phage portal protein [Caulobacteraceae bacterium]|nr:phage portal protein [Caulobacteraceae bacterium]